MYKQRLQTVGILAVEALQARADAKAADLGKTTLRAIAAGLNEAGVPTVRGGEWSSSQVMRVLKRIQD